MMKRLLLYNRRILEIMDHFKTNHQVSNTSFLLSIEFIDPDNINYVRNGKRSFTTVQIYNCIKRYDIDPRDIFLKEEPRFRQVLNGKSILKSATANKIVNKNGLKAKIDKAVKKPNQPPARVLKK